MLGRIGAAAPRASRGQKHIARRNAGGGRYGEADAVTAVAEPEAGAEEASSSVEGSSSHISGSGGGSSSLGGGE